MLTYLKLIERTNPHGAARNNAYQVTESGASLRPILDSVANWAQIHLKDFHSEIV